MKTNKYLDRLNNYKFPEEAIARKVYKYENPRTGQIYEYNRTGYYVKDGKISVEKKNVKGKITNRLKLSKKADQLKSN